MPESNATKSEVSLGKLLQDLESLEAVVATWDDQSRLTVAALTRAVEDLNKEAFARLIRALKKTPEALAALKESTADEVVYSVLRHHELIRPSLNERIEQALDSVRPMLKGHGGDVELVAVRPPNRADIRLIGACSGCPSSELTLSEGVEKAIREHCPEVTEIVREKGICASGDETAVNFVSPFARGHEKKWLYAVEVDQLKPDTLTVCGVGGQSIILSQINGKVVCYHNACAHLGMPLDMSSITDGILRCPFHSFEYSLETGECLTVPEVQLQTYAVRVVGAKVEVSIS
jgi:Fe-S cluster biogenesis protein NfuA/nitrite reductase/ring-hydroxylating ferredoxin subunit